MLNINAFVWSGCSLSELPQAPSFGGISLFSMPENRLLIVQKERGSPIRLRVYDIQKDSYQELAKPLTNAHQELILSKECVLFVRYMIETATHNAELVLWNPMTNAHKRMLGKVPFGYTLQGDIVDETLYIIATTSDDGCAAGFDWKTSSALAAALNMEHMSFDTPFHEIEDLDVARMHMLDANICLVTAYSRRGDCYYHLRDMRTRTPQKDGVQNLAEPSRYKLSFAGRDAKGGILFFGESYMGDKSAFFRLDKEDFEFTMVGQWKGLDAYYVTHAKQRDETNLVICSKRGSLDMIVIQFSPNQEAITIATLQDFYSISDIVVGEDGPLYVYAVEHGQDAKWKFFRIDAQS